MILEVNVKYLIIGIAIIVFLVALFFISYILNKRTPVPEGCEVGPTEENCMGCKISDCHVKQGIDLKELQKEIKEENEK